MRPVTPFLSRTRPVAPAATFRAASGQQEHVGAYLVTDAALPVLSTGISSLLMGLCWVLLLKGFDRTACRPPECPVRTLIDKGETR